MRQLAIKIVKSKSTPNKAVDNKPFKPNEGPVPET
jgi:hypothetical protein